MNSLDSETRARIVSALVEGVSINSIVRMTRVAKTTILRLIREVETACAPHDRDDGRVLQLLQESQVTRREDARAGRWAHRLHVDRPRSARPGSGLDRRCYKSRLKRYHYPGEG